MGYLRLNCSLKVAERVFSSGVIWLSTSAKKSKVVLENEPWQRCNMPYQPYGDHRNIGRSECVHFNNSMVRAINTKAFEKLVEKQCF